MWPFRRDQRPTNVSQEPESWTDSRGVDADLSAEVGTVAQVAARQESAVKSYRYQWVLFIDFYDAADTSPLPESPIAQAECLDEKLRQRHNGLRAA